MLEQVVNCFEAEPGCWATVDTRRPVGRRPAKMAIGTTLQPSSSRPSAGALPSVTHLSGHALSGSYQSPAFEGASNLSSAAIHSDTTLI